MNIPIIRPILYTQKTFKNVDISLACFISVSPIHGAQDAPHSPSTHSLSLRGTTRRGVCTCFVYVFPVFRTRFVTHATTRQFVNADASLPRNLHPSRLHRLRFLERDVIPDLPAGWTSVGCYTLVSAQSLQEIRFSDLVAN